MSILGAVAVGAALGTAASGYLFNYSKSEYETKISELEALISRLNEHLTTLRNLRSQVPQFWDDENAQETSRALDTTISKVEREMSTAESLARTFRTAVESLDSSKDVVKNLVSDAMGILSGVEE